jgi:hypothetical protein
MVTQAGIGDRSLYRRRGERKQGATEIAGIERRCLRFESNYSRKFLICPTLQSLLSDIRCPNLEAWSTLAQLGG